MDVLTAQRRRRLDIALSDVTGQDGNLEELHLVEGLD